MEEWKQIPEFPRYSVSSFGRIQNDATGQVLTILVNQFHVAYVGLMHEDVQHKRSVARLVARAFVPTPTDSYQAATFDTPINLNGDRLDNSAENLTWRPRWFAVKYHQQFTNPHRGTRKKVKDLETGVVFNNSWQVAITFGLLERDVRTSITEQEEVMPTRQRFAWA